MPMKMAKAEAAIRLALAYYEAFNRHDIAGIMSLMSGDCLVESNIPAPDGETFRGQEEVARYWQEFFAERPQVAVDLEEVYGLGKRCVGRWSCSWLDAAGRPTTRRGADIFRVDGNLIEEILSYVKG